MDGAPKSMLIAMEQTLLDASNRNELTASGLLADEFVEFGSSGVVYDRTAVIDAFRDNTGESFEAS